jgi:hypothetical protein
VPNTFITTNVNSSNGGLSLHPIQMEQVASSQENSMANYEEQKEIKKSPDFTKEEEDELYRQMVYLLMTLEQQKNEAFVKTLSD